MHKMSLGEVLAIGLMMFSIFFGAGNLIFPPALGQAAGDHTLVAMLGFLTTGVGLPLLGIAAIALQGGKYIEFIRRVTHPAFATGVLVILYLTIGPLFAMPRTGAVSFEIGIRPFLSADSVGVGQFIYTAAFFGLSYYLARNPSQLIDRVGKLLTPALLFFLVVLFAKSFITPLGDVLEATGNYITTPYAQGFQDGYQTMDLLASIAIGTLVVSTVRMRGYESNRELGRICLYAGLISTVLMSMVYGSLAYLGATSASVLGHSANGGQLLAAAVGILFGSAGNAMLAAIIALACLTTCVGITSGAAWFFNKLLRNRISYERLLAFSLLFSFLASNVGLTQIIALAVPFLVLIYPIVIVLVVLSMFESWIGTHYLVYRYAAYATLAFAVVDALNAAGFRSEALNALLAQYLPFYSITMGWLVPALIGAIVGWFVSSLQDRMESAE
ncbi:MAG TPA: branched-chain amino acid transport system II carrier protein [Selenomonas sp.]|nr:branched-chain amino acid transport system II carrier protein [Selenomonas sp.]